MNTLQKLVLGLVLSAVINILPFNSFGYEIPSGRSIPWSGNVGVKDGIPARTTIYQTITAGTGDRTSAIQSALNNCPAGQVVQLGPGKFNISRLSMKSNVTLRGSGISVTTIVPGGSEFLQFGAYGIAYGTAVNLVGGYTKGSITITTATNHGWSAGDHIVIDQLNNTGGDPPITNTGEGGSSAMGGRTGDGSRGMQQIVKLVAPTSGTTATLEIPLYMDFVAARTPQAAKVTMSVQNAGVESLTFDNTAGYNYPITIFNASNCWFKDVELNGTNNSGFGIYLSASYRISITGSSIHQRTGGTASDNYGITTAGTGSAYLIENNLIYNVTNGIVLQGGASGCVIAYNYFTNLWQSAYPTANRYGMGFHASHQYMNLFEGNVIAGAFFASDNYWGSNSHNTLFRNRFVMDYSKIDQQLNLGISTNQTYYNVIGNYLGTAGSETAYETYNTPYSPSSKYVYVTGSGGSYGSARTTMLRHGNWDGYTQGQKWCDSSGEPGCQGGNNDHTLPPSLYYSSKPSWYCNESTYPAVNPEGTTDALRYSKIPAQLRYEGRACSSGGVSQTSPATYQLTTYNSGDGTITSSPSGISCGSDCSESYDTGTSVTLTATPNSGYTFSGWSGACSGAGSCVVSMASNKSVTATYSQNAVYYTLNASKTGSGSLTSTPSGISCGSDCSESYVTGTSVTVTATADSGYTFTGWSGACTGTGACTIAMTAAKTVVATFTQNKTYYSLLTSKTGNGTIASTPSGISCGSDCSESYESGASVALTATADSGYTFTGWSGACTGTGNCSVAMTSAKAVAATFTQNATYYTLTTNNSGNGTISSSPAGISCGATCANSYESGTSVTLTATANSGYTFSGWSGACTGTDTCQVTMDTAKSVTATFAVSATNILSVKYKGKGRIRSKIAAITALNTPTNTGIDCGDICVEEYASETTVTLEAIPDTGYTFAGWSGDCSGTGECTVTVEDTTSVEATFNAPTSDAEEILFGGFGGGGGGGGGGCFIATAAYGSYLDPHVMTLRAFRDNVLMKNTLGRAFVKFYYAYSPAIAEKISRTDGLRFATRLALTPVVYAVAYPVVAAMVILSALLMMLAVVEGRRRKMEKPAHPISDNYFEHGPRKAFVRVK